MGLIRGRKNSFLSLLSNQGGGWSRIPNFLIVNFFLFIFSFLDEFSFSFSTTCLLNTFGPKPKLTPLNEKNKKRR